MKSKISASGAMKGQGPNVRKKFDEYWIWVISSNAISYRITGKYLFFSEDKNRLLRIAENEIQNHVFHLAKVNSGLLGKNTEYVLCLYYRDDSRKRELADRQKTEYADVKYRYWKSDETTLRGKYSKEFLDKLDENEKRYFTSKKNAGMSADISSTGAEGE